MSGQPCPPALPTPLRYGALRETSEVLARLVGSRDDAWDVGSGSQLLSISVERAYRDPLILVFIPCHIEPDMRFALIRLSDNLLPGAFKASSALAFLLTATAVRLSSVSAFWLSGIVRAGILVMY